MCVCEALQSPVQYVRCNYGYHRITAWQRLRCASLCSVGRGKREGGRYPTGNVVDDDVVGRGEKGRRGVTREAFRRVSRQPLLCEPQRPKRCNAECELHIEALQAAP